MPRRAGGRTRRRPIGDGPTPIPIPSSFRRHHSRLSPFARANLPPRMPVLGSVAKLQALADSQLDELCEDVVVLLPLWRTGLPAHAFAAGQPAAGGAAPGMGSAAASGTATPISTLAGAGGNNHFVAAAHMPQGQVQVQTVPIDSLSSTPQAHSYSIYTPSTTPPAVSLQTAHSTHSIPGVPPSSHYPGQAPQNNAGGAPPPQPGTGGGSGIGANPNHPDMRPPTEADALALAPHVPIWLPNAPRKRNESRVKLARSFMAGFEGMKALVWDVTGELERRWPLGEQDLW